MKNKSVLKNFAVVVSAVFISGCSLISPAVPQVNYYDLNFNGTEKFVVPYQIVYRNFQNMSPVKMNFVYTEKNSLQILDQYNFWTQSPEIMLQRYLFNAVRCNADSEKMLTISLTVYDFKFNAAEKKCQLGAAVRFMKSHDGRIEKNYTVEVPVDTADRASFVNGMNKCALEFTNQLVRDIKKI